MYNLIEKYFKGEMSAEEKRRLFEKTDTDSEWRNEFAAVQNLRGLVAWARSGRTAGEAGKRRQPLYLRRSFYMHFTGYAAAVLLTLTVSRHAGYSAFPHGQEPLHAVGKEMPWQEFSTPPGQTAFIRLQDSTAIWLNAGTTLRYPAGFPDGERVVELDGEAFFDVAGNSEQPFIVKTGNYRVRVTGTSFNISASRKRNEFVTHLTEGSVRICDGTTDAPAMELKPNEKAELSGGVLVKQPFANMDFLLWKDGIYAFDDVPFADMIEKLELYYDVSIIVQRKDLEAFKFSGKFRRRDGVEKALATLQKIQSFSFSGNEERSVITIR
jgi:ferric-dicitrate binding protein FerR (iron transport regulator)